MKRTITYLILFLCLNLFSQNTFTNTYNIDPVNNPKNSFDQSKKVIQYKDNYLTLGTFQENAEYNNNTPAGIPDTTHAMLMKYDNVGNVIYKNLYTPNSCDADIYQYLINDGFILAAGTTYMPKNYCGYYNPDQPPPNIDTYTKGRLFLTSTDIGTGNHRQKVYRTGMNCAVYGVSETHDQNFYVANMIFDTTGHNRSINLLKTNLDCDSISNKRIENFVPEDYFIRYFNKTETGYIMFVSGPVVPTTHIILFDKYGDTISTKNLPVKADLVSKTLDGGYIFSKGQTLVKINKDLQVEWQKTYNLYMGSFVFQTSDGNFLVGEKDFAKVNKDSVIWERRYFGNSNSVPWYYIFDAIETSDGGIIMTGFYDANTFLIKTDCQGNLIWDSSCKIPGAPKQPEPAIFPNPFNESITFRLTDISGDSIIQLKITNMMGQTVLDAVSDKNTFTINTYSLSSGIYYCFISVNDKVCRAVKMVKP